MLFANYNNYVEMGCSVDLQVNDFEPGLNLVITDDDIMEKWAIEIS